MGNACTPIIRAVDHFGDGWEGAFLRVGSSFGEDEYVLVGPDRVITLGLYSDIPIGGSFGVEIWSGKWDNNVYVPCDPKDDADCPALKRPWEMKFSVQRFPGAWILETEPLTVYGDASSGLAFECVPDGVYDDDYLADDDDFDDGYISPLEASLVLNKEYSVGAYTIGDAKPVHYRAPFPPPTLCPLPVELTLKDSSGEGWFKPGHDLYTQYFIDNGDKLVARGTLVDSGEETVEVKLPKGSYTFRAGGFGDVGRDDHSWTVSQSSPSPKRRKSTRSDDDDQGSASGSTHEQLSFSLDKDCKLTLGDVTNRRDVLDYAPFFQQDSTVSLMKTVKASALQSKLQTLGQQMSIADAHADISTATDVSATTNIVANNGVASHSGISVEKLIGVSGAASVLTALIMLVIFSVMGGREKKQKPSEYESVMDESAGVSVSP